VVTAAPSTVVGAFPVSVDAAFLALEPQAAISAAALTITTVRIRTGASCLAPNSVPPMHPFRFAVQTSAASDAAAWRERARRIEALGSSALYMPDHLGDQFSPLVALAVAAEATSTLKVGTLVADNDFRHPVVL